MQIIGKPKQPELRKKLDKVKIIQVAVTLIPTQVGGAGPFIVGLGDDNLPYQWVNLERGWENVP